MVIEFFVVVVVVFICFIIAIDVKSFGYPSSFARKQFHFHLF